MLKLLLVVADRLSGMGSHHQVTVPCPPRPRPADNKPDKPDDIGESRY